MYDQFFDFGDVCPDADMGPGHVFPVVLMSHGTGGSPEGTGWLARGLAEAGYLVIGAHHHGNTGSEPYLPEGFLCWWERAADLSALLTHLSLQGPFAGRMDLGRVAAVGFSLGAYTVLALAGAETSVARYVAWAQHVPAFQNGPAEMPDAASHIPVLIETSVVFRESWARQSDSYVDDRVRAVVAIAPPPPVRGFDPASLAAISTPVTLITGGDDKEAPAPLCADWLVQQNARFRSVSLGAGVGHYTFLGLPGPLAKGADIAIFRDAAGISRGAVHEQVMRKVITALAGQLCQTDVLTHSQFAP